MRADHPSALIFIYAARGISIGARTRAAADASVNLARPKALRHRPFRIN
jgi:hypothetical protein